MIHFMEVSFLEAIEWETFKLQSLAHLSDIRSQCCYYEKAVKMMDLVYKTRPNLCVEIGVLGGGSIYPTACALKYLKHGTIIGIDPWDLSHCLKGHSPDEEIYQWWSKKDMEVVFWAFVDMIAKYDLGEYCKVMRSDEQKAVSSFEDQSIDILHIDGNHSEAIALLDAQIYLPKVKPGGYIWFDDVDLPTTEKAVSFLSKRCAFLPNFSVQGKCHLYRV